MKKSSKIMLMMLSLTMMFGAVNVFATVDSEDQGFLGEGKYGISGIPFQYAFVDGDYKKFQSQHWMNSGYLGGIKDVSVEQHLPEDIVVEMEGHAIPSNNDYEGLIEVTKKDFGYFKIEYEEFRKYYDGTAGVFHRFVQYPFVEVDRQLYMDIGKFELEAGLTLPDLPHVAFYYEHEFRDGSKSRLTWADVQESAVSRKIGPSWQEIEEEVNIFGIRLEHVVKGFKIKANQEWEKVNIFSRRYEVSLSPQNVASQRKIRIHNQEPDTDLMTTTVQAERWFAKDKAFTSAAYRFTNLHNEEVENLREYTEFLTPFNFSNAENKIDATAQNDLDQHTWVWNLMTFPVQWLTVGSKFKAESMTRRGDSQYPSDHLPNNGVPNQVIDRTELSNTDTKRNKFAESIGVQVKAIPRTSIYTDLELEQEDYWMGENRNSIGPSPSSGEIFQRETETDVRRGIWTIGTRVSPLSMVDVTSQFRHTRSNNDFNNTRESVQGATAAIDMMNIHKNELTNRLTIRPCQWFQGALRYQLSDVTYDTRYQGEETVGSDLNTQTYAVETTFLPRADLFMTVSYEHQMIETRTPDGGQTVFVLPAFNADSSTWMFNTNYIPKPEISFTGTFFYTYARNFDDYTATGMPYGADFDQLGLTVKTKWMLRENVTLEPYYAFYHYSANPFTDFSNYNAHVMGIEAAYAWG